VELLRRGLAASREAAQAAVEAGRVLVGGAPAGKSTRLVSAADAIELVGPPPRFVSRGGEKLEAALDRFRVEVSGRVALDAGSSRGGFVDCLLVRGAAGVVAVDVGRGQLDSRLRRDPRVEVRERLNVRHLTPELVGGTRFGVVTADLSFISLRTVAHVLVGDVAADGADAIVLVKPQFEAGRVEASRGRGVIADPAVWARALAGAAEAFESSGAAVVGAMPSPLRGAKGNVEFLLHARAHALEGPASTCARGWDRSPLVEQAVSEAASAAGR
jgi:23S rRNA (cytidine1920-2'-O)/16S rRNA (cytidine1409-2'-O)-methyltransferase